MIEVDNNRRCNMDFNPINDNKETIASSKLSCSPITFAALR